MLGQAKKCAREVGAADRARMDEYLSIVRSLETSWNGRTIRSAIRGNRGAAIRRRRNRPTTPKNHAEHVELMLDMIALAFQSDTTRISTFMFGNAVSGVNFRFLEGVTDSHHEISHHSNNADKLRQYHLINRWHVDQYAYLLRKLRDMKEGENSVLDNSMVLFGSALSDGNSHNPHKLPLVLGGRGGGRIGDRTAPCLTPKIRRLRTCMYRCWTRSARRFDVSPTAPARFRACWRKVRSSSDVPSCASAATDSPCANFHRRLLPT